MDNLIKKIKEKSELSGLPDLVVYSVLEPLLKKVKNPSSEKNKKLIIKEVRSQLRRYTGQYTPKNAIKNRQKLLSRGDFNSLLNEHISTKERVGDYPLVKEIISKINPSIILDLGCGINPIAIASENVEYHAYDINHNDLEIVRVFFELNKIKGDIHHKDITTQTVFPKADLCIMFKLLDILGKDKSKITKSLLNKIEARFFIISFATKTLSGKPMSVIYRRWFENILKKLNLKYSLIRTKTELFYIVEKSQK